MFWKWREAPRLECAGGRVEGPHNYPPSLGCLVSLLYLTSTHWPSLEPTSSPGSPDHSALGSRG